MTDLVVDVVPAVCGVGVDEYVADLLTAVAVSRAGLVVPARPGFGGRVRPMGSRFRPRTASACAAVASASLCAQPLSGTGPTR